MAYKTRQREEIAAYLASIPGKHVTAGDVCAHFQAQGSAIGAATVYRQLERMVRDGEVQKYIIDEQSSACFAWLGAEARSPARTTATTASASAAAGSFT